MNKIDFLRYNVLPEGKEPWLSYDEHLKLKSLFEAVPLPANEGTSVGSQYYHLHQFLTEVAGLEIPPNEVSIHVNAFVLIRRGYKVETIAQPEYEHLHRLMDGLEEAAEDDTDLFKTGEHRELYNYLTKGMGLSVKKGRGPAWHRAKALIEKYNPEGLITNS